jgi:hypothetical protein
MKTAMSMMKESSNGALHHSINNLLYLLKEYYVPKLDEQREEMNNAKTNLEYARILTAYNRNRQELFHLGEKVEKLNDLFKEISEKYKLHPHAASENRLHNFENPLHNLDQSVDEYDLFVNPTGRYRDEEKIKEYEKEYENRKQRRREQSQRRREQS